MSMEGRFYTLHMNKILYINNCFCRKKINDVFWDPLGKKNQSHIISAAALSIPVRNEVKYSGWPTGDYRPPSLYTPHIHTHTHVCTHAHSMQHSIKCGGKLVLRPIIHLEKHWLTKPFSSWLIFIPCLKFF